VRPAGAGIEVAVNPIVVDAVKQRVAIRAEDIPGTASHRVHPADRRPDDWRSAVLVLVTQVDVLAPSTLVQVRPVFDPLKGIPPAREAAWRSADDLYVSQPRAVVAGSGRRRPSPADRDQPHHEGRKC